jgi:hypothetical protein
VFRPRQTAFRVSIFCALDHSAETRCLRLGAGDSAVLKGFFPIRKGIIPQNGFGRCGRVRHQHRRKDGNDGDHDEELDQGEMFSMLLPFLLTAIETADDFLSKGRHLCLLHKKF